MFYSQRNDFGIHFIKKTQDSTIIKKHQFYFLKSDIYRENGVYLF